MLRNVESHFAELPSANIGRSILDLSHGHKFSANVGEVIPFLCTEILPGDTFDVTTSMVVRLQTLLTPIMDNMYCDTMYWFVPARLTLSTWKNFMGESESSPWVPSVNHSLPLLQFPAGGFAVGTIADHMGIPPGVEPESADTNSLPIALPFRAYALCMQEFMRDQNLSDALQIDLDEVTRVGSNGSNYITDVAKGGMPFKAAKFHDYFTSCLPAPQRGAAVNAALIDVYSPVGASPQIHDPIFSDASHPNGFTVKWSPISGTVSEYPTNRNTTDGKYQSPSTGSVEVAPQNLYAHVVGNTTVNELRLSFQMQKYYEKLARGGSRYREIILEMFNVHSPDARMMVPEYLGGHRFPLSIHQVANQSQTATDFLGDLGAMSNTSDVHSDFIKSFTEHGYLIGCAVVRYDHSYSQGLSKMWTRRDRLSFFWPVFSALGEMPVKKREIFLSGSTGSQAKNDAVFGYQEAWAEYRYMPSTVSGELRPGVANSLATWHLGDDYATAPTLSDSWIREDKTNVDRVLAVQSSVSNQYFADMWFDIKATRPMPVYSIPGLIDHF